MTRDVFDEFGEGQTLEVQKTVGVLETLTKSLGDAADPRLKAAASSFAPALKGIQQWAQQLKAREAAVVARDAAVRTREVAAENRARDAEAAVRLAEAATAKSEQAVALTTDDAIQKMARALIASAREERKAERDRTTKMMIKKALTDVQQQARAAIELGELIVAAHTLVTPSPLTHKSEYLPGDGVWILKNAVGQPVDSYSARRDALAAVKTLLSEMKAAEADASDDESDDDEGEGDGLRPDSDSSSSDDADAVDALLAKDLHRPARKLLDPSPTSSGAPTTDQGRLKPASPADNSGASGIVSEKAVMHAPGMPADDIVPGHAGGRLNGARLKKTAVRKRGRLL